MNSGQFQIGLKAIEITPKRPVELATRRAGRGIGESCSKTKTELYASIMVWSGEVSGILIALDLTWIDRTFCEDLRARLAGQIDVATEAIWLSASHTHSGPQVARDIPFYGNCDDDYREALLSDIEAGVLEAWEKRGDSQIGNSVEIEAGLPVASRTSLGGKLGFGSRIYNAPNLKAAADTAVRCAFVRDGEKLSAVIFSVSCHPIFFWGNEYHGDFPARVRELIQEQYGPSVVVVFLQGYAGNLKPWYQEGVPLRRRIGALAKFGSPRRVFGKMGDDQEKDFSRQIFSAIRRAEGMAEQDVTSAPGSVLPPRESLVETAAGGARETVVAISRLSLPNGTTLVGMSGEAFYSYRAAIDEKTNGDVWPVGYTNGMYGYLIDQEVVAAGNGYEFNSWEKFGHRGALNSEDCANFVAALDECTSDLMS